MAKFRQEIDRERKEKENAMRRMKQKEEQNEREIADLRDKLSRASLTPQVNTLFLLISFYSICVIRSISKNYLA